MLARIRIARAGLRWSADREDTTMARENGSWPSLASWWCASRLLALEGLGRGERIIGVLGWSGGLVGQTATILLTDLVESAPTRVRLGEARADDLRRGHDALLAE